MLSKTALTVFAINFVILNYYGLQPPSDTVQLISQIGTIIYFAFFLLMPWYSKIDKTKPVPDRVTE